MKSTNKLISSRLNRTIWFNFQNIDKNNDHNTIQGYCCWWLFGYL